MINTKYTSRPVQIQAIKLPADFLSANNVEQILEFASPFIEWDFKSGQWPILKTANGDVVCNPGDWVIKNDNEAYPCNNNVFIEKYIPTENTSLNEGIVLNKFFEHIESGATYEMLMITNTNCSNESFIPTVVYKNVDTDVLYSRPFCEFVSKFEIII